LPEAKAAQAIEKSNGESRCASAAVSGAMLSQPVVNVAAVRDPCDADQMGGVVNDVHHAPVADPNAPLILVPFLTSCTPAAEVYGREVRFDFSNGIPFSLRRDSEISLSKKSASLAPCFCKSIWTATLRPFSSVTNWMPS
jgi:hypothetical protein